MKFFSLHVLFNFNQFQVNRVLTKFHTSNFKKLYQNMSKLRLIFIKFRSFFLLKRSADAESFIHDIMLLVLVQKNTQLMRMKLSAITVFSKSGLRTPNAHIFHFQVGLKVVVARFHVVEVVVEHPDAARSPSRAVQVENRKYIDRTPDIAEVLFDAPTDSHASVASVRYHDNLVGIALDTKVFGLTEKLLDG